MNTNARTAPTVSSSPKVNRRQLRTLEVHLGAFQLAVLLGLVTGSMACAFYLGFFSGQRVGYENALVGSASTLARFALNTKDLNNADAVSEEGNDNSMSAFKDQPKRNSGKAVRETKEPALSLLNEVGAAPKSQKTESAEQSPAPVALEGAIDSASSVSDAESGTTALAAAAQVKPNIDDEVIRVYGNERQTKKTSIATLKESMPSASVTMKSDKVEKVVETVTQENKRTKPQVAVQQKPQVLAALQPESKMAKPQQIQVRKLESVPVKSILAAGWYAQVAAPRKMADAEAMANRLRKNGFPVSIESASVKGEAYYRVIVGPEDNKKQAQVLVEQLKSERSVQGEPFIRNIR